MPKAKNGQDIKTMNIFCKKITLLFTIANFCYAQDFFDTLKMGITEEQLKTLFPQVYRPDLMTLNVPDSIVVDALYNNLTAKYGQPKVTTKEYEQASVYDKHITWLSADMEIFLAARYMYGNVVHLYLAVKPPAKDTKGSTNGN